MCTPELDTDGGREDVPLFGLTSTRYAMFASKPVEHLPRWLRASSLHISQASLDALNGLYALQKLLVGCRVLDDDLGFP